MNRKKALKFAKLAIFIGLIVVLVILVDFHSSARLFPDGKWTSGTITEAGKDQITFQRNLRESMLLGESPQKGRWKEKAGDQVWTINRVDGTVKSDSPDKTTLHGRFEEKEEGRLLFHPGQESPLFLINPHLHEGESKWMLWEERGGKGEWELKVGVLHRLSHMDLRLFALAALFYFLCASFAGIRWHWLLRANSLEVSLWEAWRLNWIGVFFNNVVPGLTGGDLVKAFYIARLTGKKTVPILTVIVDRILGLAALALLAMIVVLCNFTRFKMLALAILFILVGIAFITVCFLSRRVRKTLKLSRIMRKLPGSRMLMQIDEALTFYRTKKGALLFWLVASMVNHILSTGFVAVLGYAMGLDVPLLTYFVLVPVINIASAVPLAPAGWGVGEGLYGFFFQKWGEITFSEGVGLSAISRVLMTAWSLLGGVLLLFMKGRVSTSVIEQEMSADKENPE